MRSSSSSGCHSPVGAYAEVVGEQIRLRAVSFQSQGTRRGERKGPIKDPVALGQELAAELKHAPAT